MTERRVAAEQHFLIGQPENRIINNILFGGVLAIAIFLEIGTLAVFLLPLWLYSFFDSYNLRRQRMDGTEDADAYLFGMSDLDSQRLSELLSKRHSLIGWTLVLLGLYALYRTVMGQLMWWIKELFPWMDWLYDLLVWDAPRILGTLLIIALGLWFIRGPKKRAPEEIPVFTPGPQAEDPVYRPEFFQEPPHAPDIPGEEPEPEEEEPHGDE